MDPRTLIDAARERGMRSFESGRRLCTFEDYLRDLLADPCRWTRTTAQYLADLLEFYGTRKVRGLAGGEATRWSVFDAPFDDGRDPLVGLEGLQADLHRAIRNFAQGGQADRLILLHGPNGSGKSTVCALLQRALEDYSARPDGVLCRFSWIFPTREASGGRLGFEGGGGPMGFEKPVERDGPEPSWALLPAEQIAARIPCELKDPPFFLLPAEVRAEVLPRAFEEWGKGRSPRPEPTEWALRGDLCQKCKEIATNLLNAYRGDLARVLQHIQVERIYISRRYRCGAVTVSPQFHVDAGEIQVAVDRSAASLPAALQNLNLFVPLGDLADANGGILEFSDLLKRPIEANQYLLTAVETGMVTLPHQNAFLNLVMVASANEKHLDAFKKSPLFSSFKARMELLEVPYLLRAEQEKEIYADVLAVMGRRAHVAPHVADVAALWAVLTRLNRPDPEAYPPDLRGIVREITPLQKARLYDTGELPSGLRSEEGRRLRAAIGALIGESAGTPDYEGRFGASPREMKTILLNALHRVSDGCVTPLHVFEELEALVRDKSVYEFLQVPPEGSYRDPARFIEDVRAEYLRIVGEEIREAMELITADEYLRVFSRYVLHVKALQTKERVRNPVSGEMEEPDLHTIREVEKVICREEPEEFRRSLLGRIGAWRLDHRDDEVRYPDLFPEYLRLLREDFFGRHQRAVAEIQENLLRSGSDEFAQVPLDLRQRVLGTLERMENRLGYCDRCAKQVIAWYRRATER